MADTAIKADNRLQNLLRATGVWVMALSTRTTTNLFDSVVLHIWDTLLIREGSDTDDHPPQPVQQKPGGIKALLVLLTSILNIFEVGYSHM